MSDFSNARSFGLDFARATAILLVLFSHATLLLGPISKSIQPLIGFSGAFGVELFFALSGFLIGTILLRMFERPVGASELSYFWMRRWLRTVPAYYCALLFVWGTSHRFDPIYLVFLQGPVRGNFDLHGLSWSLAIEEWFYVLFPLVCLALAAVVRRPNVLLAAALIFLFASTAFRHAQFVIGGDLLSFSLNPRRNTFRFDTLALGVLLAWVMSKPSVRAWFRARAGLVWAATAIGFALVAAVQIGNLFPSVWWHGVYVFNAFGVAACLIVLSLFLIPTAPAMWIAAPVVYVSAVSYTIYLWHMLLLDPFMHAYPHLRGAETFVGYIAVCLIASGPLYAATEMPFLKFRQWLTKRVGSGSPSSSLNRAAVPA